MSGQTDGSRLREVWNGRYAAFSLSESGWFGAGDALNSRIYTCKLQALRRAIAGLGLTREQTWSVLDAGCGQGYFARFYQQEYPGAQYIGIDISERAVDHLRQTVPDAEFHAADLCTWSDPANRTFDIIQSIEVLHLILDDETLIKALQNLATRLSPGGALLVTAALPEESLQVSDYLRFRSRRFWERAIASLGLQISSERPMYYCCRPADRATSTSGMR